MNSPNDMGSVRPATSLEYARPMAAVRVRQVLPRSLAMTLMICACVLTGLPAMAIGVALYGHEVGQLPDTHVFILFVTGIVGMVLFYFSIYLAPRVPRTAE